MNTIWDAIQAAQARNKEEDRLRALRQQDAMPVLPNMSPTNTPLIPLNGDSGDGNENQRGPTFSPAEQYANAIAVNKSPVVHAPVVGTLIGVLNNKTIRDYEEKNPNLAVKDPNRMYTPLVQQMIESIMGRSNVGPFGYDNINAFPNTYNFNQDSGGGPNDDISGSMDTTDQSPSVGTGNDDDTAVA